ncbi:glycoside hydrolase family 16 protein [Schizopora paradoxa]|uniref:Glycoside hydrolase family 16 protein n=1 Tax=Schizopora paradoxa TaxID=27342 RepID=A0A0H2S7J9_9AGAM|nr:glycoside hydrolase family 16 protein [Schizopora paradoxa]
MRLSVCASVLLFVVGQTTLASAEFAPHRSVLRATERLHEYAKRRSAGLARDLRVVFQGLKEQDSVQGDSNRVYCVRPDDPFSAFNGSSTSPATASPGASGTSQAAVPTFTSAYSVVEKHSGSNFFDGWDFWDHNVEGGDPTNGNVDYQNQADATSSGLIDVNSAGNAVMRLETTATVSGNRKSVRITTQSTFSTGIFVLDAVHMPEGCGTWPAFWTNGPRWPVTGEIDILEGVHDYTNNQATLHTDVGCTIPSGSTPQSLNIASTSVNGDVCAANLTGNAGCGFRSNSNTTFGSGFNSIGGGVYAMLWDNDGIHVYFFPRGSIPADLLAEKPQPNTWGTAMAFWPASTCNPSQFFVNHSVIFDLTLCGDWAGAVWGASGIPGQTQSCQAITGVSTCTQYIQQNGAAFQNAYWEVSSVTIYQTSRQS